jgi:hypothetical protein
VERFFVERPSPQREQRRGESLRKGKSAVERVSPWRKGLRGENLSEERRALRREELQGCL